MNGFRMKLVTVVFLSFVLPVSAAAELTMASAINKAGRQRMLTQRILKTYCQVGNNVQEGKAKIQLQEAIKLFDSQLTQLDGFIKNADTRKALEKVRKLWNPYKIVASEVVTKKGAKKLLSNNEDLLRASNKIVMLLQDESGTASGRLVNISGRQRMLSQRIGMYYMLRNWGIRTATTREELDRAQIEYKGAHAELLKAAKEHPSIIAELDKAGIQWSLLEYSLTNEDKSVLALFVVETTDKILYNMNLATKMFENITVK